MSQIQVSTPRPMRADPAAEPAAAAPRGASGFAMSPWPPEAPTAAPGTVEPAPQADDALTAWMETQMGMSAAYRPAAGPELSPDLPPQLAEFGDIAQALAGPDILSDEVGAVEAPAVDGLALDGLAEDVVAEDVVARDVPVETSDEAAASPGEAPPITADQSRPQAAERAENAAPPGTQAPLPTASLAEDAVGTAPRVAAADPAAAGADDLLPVEARRRETAAPGIAAQAGTARPDDVIRPGMPRTDGEGPADEQARPGDLSRGTGSSAPQAPAGQPVRIAGDMPPDLVDPREGAGPRVAVPKAGGTPALGREVEAPPPLPGPRVGETSAASPWVAARHATVADPRQVLHQVAEAVVRTRGEQTEIALAPEELGRLRLILSGPDRAQVTIWAERPETLELVRRNADLLAQTLSEAGVNAQRFEFRQDRPGGGPGAGRAHHRDEEPEAGFAPATLVSLTPTRLSDRRIDIRL